MNANIILKPGSVLAKCLIVRLDNSSAVFKMDDAGVLVTNCHIYGALPNLWQWVRLWWKLRYTRKIQRETNPITIRQVQR